MPIEAGVWRNNQADEEATPVEEAAIPNAEEEVDVRNNKEVAKEEGLAHHNYNYSFDPNYFSFHRRNSGQVWKYWRRATDGPTGCDSSPVRDAAVDNDVEDKDDEFDIVVAADKANDIAMDDEVAAADGRNNAEDDLLRSIPSKKRRWRHPNLYETQIPYERQYCQIRPKKTPPCYTIVPPPPNRYPKNDPSPPNSPSAL
jgi:hypothetical protein